MYGSTKTQGKCSHNGTKFRSRLHMQILDRWKIALFVLMIESNVVSKENTMQNKKETRNVLIVIDIYTRMTC
jgi:hypothetical protein